MFHTHTKQQTNLYQHIYVLFLSANYVTYPIFYYFNCPVHTLYIKTIFCCQLFVSPPSVWPRTTKVRKHSCSCHMFRPLQNHHQGSIYKGVLLQQIMSRMRVRWITMRSTRWPAVIETPTRQRKDIPFCSLDHAFSNYDEIKPTKCLFKVRQTIYLEYQCCYYMFRRCMSVIFREIQDPLGFLKTAPIQRRNM
jgi:hypothetical protein